MAERLAPAWISSSTGASLVFFFDEIRRPPSCSTPVAVLPSSVRKSAIRGRVRAGVPRVLERSAAEIWIENGGGERVSCGTEERQGQQGLFPLSLVYVPAA